MTTAQTYDQFAALALELDRIEGKTAWKMAHESSDYDCDLIYNRLEDLRSARKSGDVGRMMYLLRAGECAVLGCAGVCADAYSLRVDFTGLLRNLGGLGNHKLYSYSNIGTKKLIEQYIEEVVFQLNYICDMDMSSVTLKDKIS